MRSVRQYGPSALVVLAIAAAWTLVEHSRIGRVAAQRTQSTQSARAAEAVMPRYDSSGALILPEDYAKWIFVGAGLGIDYNEAPPAPTHEMFSHTLMEPTAYQSFVQTGTFREGTMFALVLQGKGDKVLPARRGTYANEVHGVEIAVKDHTHAAEGWSYYGFGGMGAIRKTASAQPKSACVSCHAEHAARDHVFLQFYPLLADAAHIAK